MTVSTQRTVARAAQLPGQSPSEPRTSRHDRKPAPGAPVTHGDARFAAGACAPEGRRETLLASVLDPELSVCRRGGRPSGEAAGIKMARYLISFDDGAMAF